MVRIILALAVAVSCIFPIYNQSKTNFLSAYNDSIIAGWEGQSVLNGAGGSTTSPSGGIQVSAPMITPDRAVKEITNTYLPLRVGNQWTYESNTPEGLQRTVTKVLKKTRTVMGIEATIVRDRDYLNGVIQEDTYDWFAQDVDGNVWYLGEEVQNYVDGKPSDKSGSWEAGVNGAIPGIAMYADPAAHKGETYHLEYSQGIAEDMAKILSAKKKITVPYGSFTKVVKTYDFTPLDPEAREHKYYAPGVGLIRSDHLDANKKVEQTSELVKFKLGVVSLPLPVGIPVITPERAVKSITNSYAPLCKSSKWTYESETPDGLESTVTEVLSQTRTVMGIEATVIRDRDTLNGVIQEDTFDWFAQDIDGNVWYLGEEVQNYVNGQPSDKAGSWEAGVNGAIPGIAMYANPAAHIGETYNLEYLKGVAEDKATLLSATDRVKVPFGDFRQVVKTYDFTPLDPAAREHKFYAPGVGLIRTDHLDARNKVEQTSVLKSFQKGQCN